MILTPDEDMFIEDLSRADSLRICGPNRALPRGIGDGGSCRFGAPWYTAEELEVLRDETRLLLWWFLVRLKMLRDKENCCCVPVDGQAAVPNEIVVPAEVLREIGSE